MSPKGRSLFRPWVVLIALALVVAACSDSATEDDSTDADDAGATEPGDDGAETDDDGTETGDDGAEGDGLVIDGELIADAELLEAALEEGRLEAYLGWNQVVVDTVIPIFEEDTGLQLDVIRAASGTLFERMITEHGAGQLAADVVAMADHAFLQETLDAGVLEPHIIPAWDRIPDEYKADDGLYYFIILGHVMLAYNEELLSAEEAPSSWEDLLDEQWRDQIAIVPIAQGAVGYTTALFQRETYGIEYWEDLAAQNPRLYGSIGGPVDDVVRGEVPVGMARAANISENRAQGAPIAPIWPEDGVPMFVHWGGVAADAQNPNAARVFVNWFMSEHGQNVIRSDGEYVVHMDALPPEAEGVEFPPLDELNAFVPEVERWVELREVWADEYNQILDSPLRDG